MTHALRLFFELLGAATFAFFVLLLIVGCVGDFRHWRAHRHDARDEFGNYLDGLREPGMGSLDPDAPAYSELADEQPGVVETLDAARLRGTR